MARSNGACKKLGKYIVADPEICHGKPTFKGTRVMVHDIVALCAKGWTPVQLADAYDVPKAAIEEAIRLAARAVLEHYTRRTVTPKLATLSKTAAPPTVTAGVGT